MNTKTLVILGVAGVAIFLYVQSQNQKMTLQAAAITAQSQAAVAQARPLSGNRTAETISAVGNGLAGVLGGIGKLFN